MLLGRTNVFSINNTKSVKRFVEERKGVVWKYLAFHRLTSWKKNVSSTTKCQCTQFTQLYYSYLQSIARPLGQPSVVFTIDKAWDPSLQALMILAGRNQSVQNIYLKEEHKKTHQMTYKPSYIMYLSRVNMWTTLTFLFVPHIHIPKKKKKKHTTSCWPPLPSSTASGTDN